MLNLVPLLVLALPQEGVAPAPIDVHLRGEPFVTLRWQGFSRPVLWPVLAHGGHAVTRAWPVDEGAGEPKDHVHQKSLWFAHGDVNGVDFWTEGPKAGRVVVQSTTRSAGADDRVTLRLACAWNGPDGKPVCTETRTLAFAHDGDVRTIDCTHDVHATHGALRFGDTKEGTMAIRVAPGLCFDQEGSTGHALSSQGRRDKDVWGTRARWVAFDGLVRGTTLGVAVLDHSANLRHPTTWHARPYGLLAANPFGLHDFEKAKAGAGEHTVDAGATLSLRYRVVVFLGRADAALLDAQWRAFVGQEAESKK
jgi:hypothetical protein